MGVRSTKKWKVPGDELETPPWLYKRWDEVFNFQLDLAANERNSLCRHWLDKESDTLTMTPQAIVEHLAGGNGWCNPPYSQKAGPLWKWVNQLFRAAEAGGSVLALLPDDSSTAYYEAILRNPWSARRMPVFKRLRFYYKGKESPWSAPMPSMLVHFFDQRN